MKAVLDWFMLERCDVEIGVSGLVWSACMQNKHSSFLMSHKEAYSRGLAHVSIVFIPKTFF